MIDPRRALITAKSAHRIARTSPRRLGTPAWPGFFRGWVPRTHFVFLLFAHLPSPPLFKMFFWEPFQSGFQTDTETGRVPVIMCRHLWHLWRSQNVQFRICDLGHTLWNFYSFLSETDLVIFCYLLEGTVYCWEPIFLKAVEAFATCPLHTYNAFFLGVRRGMSRSVGYATVDVSEFTNMILDVSKSTYMCLPTPSHTVWIISNIKHASRRHPIFEGLKYCEKNTKNIRNTSQTRCDFVATLQKKNPAVRASDVLFVFVYHNRHTASRVALQLHQEQIRMVRGG